MNAVKKIWETLKQQAQELNQLKEGALKMNSPIKKIKPMVVSNPKPAMDPSSCRPTGV